MPDRPDGDVISPAARRWHFLQECSGACGDLGTFIPHVIGAITVAGLGAAGVLFGFGVFLVSSGLFYGLPVPVQPMKAVSAVILTNGLRPGEIAAAGLLMGALLFALGVTGAIGRVSRFIPQSYARAYELWKQLGSPSEFLHIPRGQSIYHAIRGRFDLALRMDKDLLRLSRQRNDPARLVLAHYSSGRTLMFTGRLSSSQSHLEEALALYDKVSHSSLVDQAGVDPCVTAQAVLGSVLFCLGYPDQAVARSNGAIAEAQRLAHQPSLAITLAFDARLHCSSETTQPWVTGQPS